VAEPADLDETVADLVDRLAEKSPEAAAVAKHLVERRRAVDRETGLELEREYIGDYLFHEDVREGLDAFAAGRQPEF